MRELIGVHIGGMVKGEVQALLCFEWNLDEENASHIKARYGNRKFFTTLFKAKNEGSIILLQWKNDVNGHIYEIRKPKLSKDGDLLRMDLTKEFSIMGLESKELNDKSKRGGGCNHFYAHGNWVHIGEQGYYESYNDNFGENYLNFYFAYPGLKIGNSFITKIEIETFDSIKNDNMEPMYDFMRTVMDDLSAVNRYTVGKLVELFTEHFPRTMFIEVWCNDKLLRASVDHMGEPRWRFCREDIVDGVRDKNAPWIKHPKPLELVVKELGL